jgi:hypothetical protein
MFNKICVICNSALVTAGGGLFAMTGRMDQGTRPLAFDNGKYAKNPALLPAPGFCYEAKTL